MRRLPRLALLAAGVIGAGSLVARGAALASQLVRSWPDRVAVEGPSMAPVLQPGDWLLVDPAAYRRHPPVVGDVVVVADPRQPNRLLVKRVQAVIDGEVEVRGDAAMASTDSRTFGPVPAASVTGRVWARYWPPARIGRLGRHA